MTTPGVRIRVVLTALVLAGATVAAQPTRQDEFVPISQLPPTESLPAAPLLIAAYVLVLLGFFIYVFSLARRVSAVQQEMRRLEQDIQSRARR